MLLPVFQFSPHRFVRPEKGYLRLWAMDLPDSFARGYGFDSLERTVEEKGTDEAQLSRPLDFTRLQLDRALFLPCVILAFGEQFLGVPVRHFSFRGGVRTAFSRHQPPT